MRKLGRKAVRFYIPNATRVAGVHNVYQSLIKSRWNLNCFFNMEGAPAYVKRLSNNQFMEVAQMEAVTSYAAALSKVVQSDNVGSLSYTILRCYRVHVVYATKKVWDVAYVDEHKNLKNQ